MRIFSALYNKVMQWSQHRHAPYYLFSLSFIESFFFLPPPDIMLAPMALAKPSYAWNYALLTTIASVLGGIIGYLIGDFAFQLAHSLIIHFGYEPTYQKIQTWFHAWGVWLTLGISFTPIPYQLFTITAGATKVPFFAFFIASIFGRGARFFLVTALMLWGGERMKSLLTYYIDYISWATIGIGIVIYCFFHIHLLNHLI